MKYVFGRNSYTIWYVNLLKGKGVELYREQQVKLY